MQNGTDLFPIEIKSGKTIASDYFASIHYWRKLLNESELPAWLIYTGDQQQKRHGIRVINWKMIKQTQKL